MIKMWGNYIIFNGACTVPLTPIGGKYNRHTFRRPSLCVSPARVCTFSSQTTHTASQSPSPVPRRQGGLALIARQIDRIRGAQVLRVQSEKGVTVHRMHYLCMPAPDTLLNVCVYLKRTAYLPLGAIGKIQYILQIGWNNHFIGIILRRISSVSGEIRDFMCFGECNLSPRKASCSPISLEK